MTIGDTPPSGRAPFYTVTSTELFIGEDAAEAIRTYRPGAEVVVLSSVDEAVRAISGRPEVTASLVISPHESLSDSALVKLLEERNAALLLLTGTGSFDAATSCRTLSAELPFTNDTICALLDELAQQPPNF